MHNVRFPLQAVHQTQRGSGEKHILAPIGGRVRAVDRAVGDGFAANQIDWHAVHLAVIDLRAERASVRFHREAEKQLRRGQLLTDSIVIGQQQTHIHAHAAAVFGGQSPQRLGQGTSYIS